MGPGLTHPSSLALLLQQEQLSPVSGSGLHPKYHQVAQRQHPQEGGQEELSQSTVPVTWWTQGKTAGQCPQLPPLKCPEHDGEVWIWSS